MDWGVIFATLCGPILAVLVTRWVDSRSRRISQRYAVFSALMSTRRLTVNVKHVEALNLIEIEFYGCKPVLDAWQSYHRHLNDPTNFPPRCSDEEFPSRENTRLDLLTKLIFEMAKELNYGDLQQIDIRNGGYSPTGWYMRDEQAQSALKFLNDLSNGTRALPIRVELPANQKETGAL